MRRYELTDEQWEFLKDLLPQRAATGRPPANLREVLSAIFWILRSGAPWRDLPERYGPWKTVYHWFNQWRKDGTWARILERLQIRLDREGRIDWDLWCVDGSSIRASRAAAGGGEKGGLTNRRTTLWAAQEAGLGPSCTWLLTAKACRSRRK
jgi:transposase